MARGAVLAHAPRDLCAKAVVEHGAVAQHDEQRQPAVDVDRERVEDLVEREHRTVDLARPHSRAAAVDRRVRAPVDDRAAARRDLDPVAVAPDAGVGVEARLAQALAIGILPEGDRH